MVIAVAVWLASEVESRSKDGSDASRSLSGSAPISRRASAQWLKLPHRGGVIGDVVLNELKTSRMKWAVATIRISTVCLVRRSTMTSNHPGVPGSKKEILHVHRPRTLTVPRR